MGCGRLEPTDWKLSYWVLRGEGHGEVAPVTRQAEAGAVTLPSTVTYMDFSSALYICSRQSLNMFKDVVSLQN